MNHYQALAASVVEKRKAQPVASALIDLLWQAAASEHDSSRRNALEIRAIGISAHIVRTWQDITQDEAMAEMVAAGLAPEGTEPYAVFVAGERVGGFLARNRWHAVNKAKKEHGLDIAEYRRSAAGHEIHGVSLVEPVTAPELFERIARIDARADQLLTPDVAPEPKPLVAHVAGIERREVTEYKVRATCSCGWRGIWHRTEPMTRVSARAHAEAYR